MDILFITTRNIATTSGELRLIKNRADALKETFEINTKFIAYIDSKRAKNHNGDGVHNFFETQYVTYNKNAPFTFFTRYKNFEKAVLETIKVSKPKLIIVSGIIPSLLVRRIKKNHKTASIVMDVHGATEEVLEYPRNGLIFSKIFHSYMDYGLKKSLKYAEGAFVVSNQLKEYMINKYRYGSNLKYFVVPCANSIRVQSRQEYEANRLKWRNRISVEPHEILFVYSGGASKWQMVSETIELFQQIKHKINADSKLLIMSHHIETIKKENSVKDDDIIFKSFSQDQVQDVLSACDVSFLLREDTITNNVAFPNKFLEYVQAKTFIITTPFIKDVAEICTRNELGAIVDLDEIDSLIDDLNKEVAENNKNIEKYERTLKEISFEKTLIPFVKFIEDKIGE